MKNDKTTITDQEFHLLLGLGARSTEIYLWTGLNSTGGETPDFPVLELSKLLGVHVSSVYRALSRLVNRNLIEVENAGNNIRIRKVRCQEKKSEKKDAQNNK